MEAVLIGVLVACVVAIVLVIALYERELRRMAHFLEKREQGSNQRISIEFATRGIREVANAVNDELDDLRDARVRQEQHERALRQDLASLSHDIRTPLAGAQGYLQLYERTEDPQEKQRCLTEAVARLSAMRELTDQLFEYAKAADVDSPLKTQPVAVFPVLSKVLAGAYPQFKQRNWEPRIQFADEALQVQANEEALTRIFSNLLTNALRHGVAAPCIKQEGGRIQFINRVDNATKIDPDQLFQRFYRADGARTQDGSGLGLAIVANLCARMGGSVSARLEARPDAASGAVSASNEAYLVIEVCFQPVEGGDPNPSGHLEAK